MRDTATCRRCGRTWQSMSPAPRCGGCGSRDTYYADRDPDAFQGRTERRGLIWVFIPDEPAADEPVPNLPDFKHGTNAGYYRHQRRGERACDDCREAIAERSRQRRAAKRAEREAEKAAAAAIREHGTRTGYRQHRELGEIACKPCRDANARQKANNAA